jgi:hypothetical protein
MDICEYSKDELGYWRYRKYKNAVVFNSELNHSHSNISIIRLGLTRSHRARITEWKDIHWHLREYLTPELRDQPHRHRLLKIGADFFDICDTQEHIGYSRRKTVTYFLRYLENRQESLIDMMLV